MPGDPKECGKQAENCLRLAKIAQTSELATQFERLAQSWLRVADDLEKAEAYLMNLHAGKKAG
jgi:hypothetical protein